MQLGIRSLSGSPLATSYKGITYPVEVSLSNSWNIEKYLSKSLGVKWNIQSGVTKSFVSSWDIQESLQVNLNANWDMQSYVHTFLDVLWDIDSQTNARTSSAYFLKPVDRAVVVCPATSENNCEE